MAKVEINGKVIEAPPGQATIIEVADQAGITIPRFCYHKKLSIAANCRMCLVEVERAPKPVPACATPVSDGMKVWTRSPKALAAQKSVMEFLLINHPLDCPICDQGGECELQDVAMGYGGDISRFHEGKRVVADKDLGPLIATDMTRCIHCTRCVRFGTEVAGLPEMGATGRGENMRIGTYIEQNVTSEVSGNMIDVCPVGALTSKPYRFTARGWELRQTFAVSPHDSLGSHLSVHTRGGQVMRVVPRDAEPINETWISDRDRFSYEGLHSPARLTQPMLRTSAGGWEAVSWDVALEAVVNRLQNVMHQFGPGSVTSLVSPNATTEECYLLQRLLRGLGCHDIEHRTRQQDFRHSDKVIQYPSLGIPIAELEQQQGVMLIGCQIHSEQPVLGLRLRKAALAGTEVTAISPVGYDWHFPVLHDEVVLSGDMLSRLAGIAKAMMVNEAQDKTKIPVGAAAWLAEVHPTLNEHAIAKAWLAHERSLIVLGALAIHHPEYSQLSMVANLISQMAGAKIAVLSPGANALGAWLTGCLPHLLPGGKACASPAYPSNAAAEDKLIQQQAYVIWGLSPEDCIYAGHRLGQFVEARSVIVASAFRHPELDKVAEIYLPIAAPYETAGTFVNMAGTWQSVGAVTAPPGEAKPGWKVLRVLSNLFDIKDSDFETVEAVLSDCQKAVGELKPLLDSWDWWCPDTALVAKPQRHEKAEAGLVCVMPLPVYRTDALVRHAAALQKTQASAPPTIGMHSHTATALQLAERDSVSVQSALNEAVFPLRVDDHVPQDCIVLPSGFVETAVVLPYERVTVSLVKRGGESV